MSDVIYNTSVDGDLPFNMMRMGAAPDGSRPMTGVWCELRVYQGALTEVQVTEKHDELKAKWGI